MDFAMKSTVVPMRFYTNWDVDRTSSSAITRTLSMKFTRLCLTKTLATENTFIIAVKLQGYRRILRSNDIVISSPSKLDYALDISFTIQYCHYIKRKSNVLDIIIQRRKKYKNRQIPGFKTLAFGNINLDEVLQYGGYHEISMWDTACLKRLSVQDFHAGTIYISNCQSQVVDSAEQDTAKWVLKSNGKYGNVLSEEEVDDYSSQYDSDFEDFEQRPHARTSNRHGKQSLKKLNQKNIKQKVVALLKKFRVADEEDNVSNVAGSTSSRVLPPTELELQEIFEELDNISDSGPELEPDKMSIVSNPRPGIRPFFGSKSDNLPAIKDDHMPFDDSDSDEPDQDQESSEETPKESCYWEQELPTTSISCGFSSLTSRNPSKLSRYEPMTVPPGPMSNRRDKLKHSLTIHSITSDSRPSTYQNSNSGQLSVRSLALPNANKKSLDQTLFLDTLAKFDTNNALSLLSVVPSNIWLTSSVDFPWIQKVEKSKLDKILLFDCTSLSDVRSTIFTIIGRIQKFCNSNSAAPPATRIGIFGSDKLISHVLRTYVDSLQNKSCQEWLDYLRFCIIVLPSSAVGRFICQLPSMEGYLESFWRGVNGNLTRISAVFENGAPTLLDHQEFDECLSSVTMGHNNVHQRFLNLSIGEVMLQLESKSCGADGPDDVDSSQIFIPFLSELTMGNSEEYSANPPVKSSLEDHSSLSQSSAPMMSSTSQNTFSTNISPPVSPHSRLSSECREVHVEYWTCSALPSSHDHYASSGGRVIGQFAGNFTSSNKFSMKATVRNLSVAREPMTSMLCILFAKEKKKDKVLQKLGRKSKQKSCNDFIQSQSRLVSSVTRMLCSSGSGKNALSLDVTIDGVPWRRIRYFQVSTQWQTHVKLFPISFSV